MKPNISLKKIFSPKTAFQIKYTIWRSWWRLIKVGRFLNGQFDMMVTRRVMPNLLTFYHERNMTIWLLAIIIGISVAYVSLFFRMLIGLVQLPWLGTMSERVYNAATTTPWLLILLAPTIGGLTVGWLLYYIKPNQRPFNVADVIEARAIKNCQIPVIPGMISALVAAISLGSGASSGREGPVVHLGALIASTLQSRFNLPQSALRTLLACGVAAAISASFNAPIAAVLFAHEVILAHYALRAFVPIVISSVIATVIARVHLGDFPAFIIPSYQITSYWEFPAFALLGLVCAAVAILFQFSLMFTDQVARNITMPLWMRPALGGFLVGLIALLFPQVLGVGYDTTDAALNQQLSLDILLALLVAKTAATAITLASRFGGGIFSPSLYLGAMAGGAYGIIAANVFPEAASSHGVYAIIGMGAVAAAVLGAPISTTMIVFELTGGYALTIALLLAVSISTGLSQAVHGMSFFHWQLSMRGLFIHSGAHVQIIRSIKVKDFITYPEEHEEKDKLIRSADDEAPWLTLEDNLESTLRAFDDHGCEVIQIVDENDVTIIIGWAHYVKALKHLNDALIDAHVEEHR